MPGTRELRGYLPELIGTPTQIKTGSGVSQTYILTSVADATRSKMKKSIVLSGPGTTLVLYEHYPYVYGIYPGGGGAALDLSAELAQAEQRRQQILTTVLPVAVARYVLKAM